VAGINGLDGSFRLEWVAALPWNQWQLWSGICKSSKLDKEASSTGASE